MKKSIAIMLAAFLLVLAGCASHEKHNPMETTTELAKAEVTESTNTEENRQEEETSMKKEKISQMTVTVGDKNFLADLADNTAVEELTEMMKDGPVTISMSDYSGFEKLGSLGRSLTTSNKQTTTKSGDIVLYSGNQIVVFYGSNSWSYTRLAKVKNLKGWEEALGKGDVTITFSLQ